MRCRAAAISEVDRGIGRLSRMLEATGELDNTAIVFYSDNGYFNGEHRVTKSKGLPYEESIQVPFAIAAAAEGCVRRPARQARPAGRQHRHRADHPRPDRRGAVHRRAGDCRTLDGRSLLPGLADPATARRIAHCCSRSTSAAELARRQPARVHLHRRAPGPGQVYVEYQRVARRAAATASRSTSASTTGSTPIPRERRNLWPPRTGADEIAQAELDATMRRLLTCSGNAAGIGPPPQGNPCE